MALLYFTLTSDGDICFINKLDPNLTFLVELHALQKIISHLKARKIFQIARIIIEYFHDF